MHTKLIISFLVLVSFSTYARKPAVEDMVGIEHEEAAPNPKGTDVLFDFSREISDLRPNQNVVTVSKKEEHKKNDQKIKQTPSENLPFSAMSVLWLILLMPAALWTIMYQKLKHYERKKMAIVKSFPKREQEEKSESKDDHKKAS